MNQILDTIRRNISYDKQTSRNTEKKSNFIKNSLLKKFFTAQFLISLFVITLVLIICIMYFLNINKSEEYSNVILNNYEILRLYSDNNYSNLESLNSDTNLNSTLINDIFATIRIPKIDAYYPVFNSISSELLALSPCKFAGSDLSSNSNICIAGHNYDNDLFFSRISELEINDTIILTDFNNISITYFIYSIYEVEASDLSPIYEFNIESKELTLVTCNNINSKRIIVKAKN